MKNLKYLSASGLALALLLTSACSNEKKEETTHKTEKKEVKKEEKLPNFVTVKSGTEVKYKGIKTKYNQKVYIDGKNIPEDIKQFVIDHAENNFNANSQYLTSVMVVDYVVTNNTKHKLSIDPFTPHPSYELYAGVYQPPENEASTVIEPGETQKFNEVFFTSTNKETNVGKQTDEFKDYSKDKLNIEYEIPDKLTPLSSYPKSYNVTQEVKDSDIVK